MCFPLVLLIIKGIHGREWISVTVATYIINELVEDKNNQKFCEKLNFHILPMANPDGYVHTWWDTNNITTRLWRKNKNTKFINKSLKFGSLGVRGDRSKCHGVDLNRNFDFHWNGILLLNQVFEVEGMNNYITFKSTQLPMPFSILCN